MKSQPSWQPIALVILLTIVVFIGFNSYVIINPGEAGVLSTLGKARDGVLLEGVHFKTPLVVYQFSICG